MRVCDYYKIGLSFRPEERTKQIRYTTVRPDLLHDPVLVHKLYVSNMLRVEAILLRRFRRNRIKGEWFSLSQDQVDWITQQNEQTLLEIEGQRDW